MLVKTTCVVCEDFKTKQSSALGKKINILCSACFILFLVNYFMSTQLQILKIWKKNTTLQLQWNAPWIWAWVRWQNRCFNIYLHNIYYIYLINICIIEWIGAYELKVCNLFPSHKNCSTDRSSRWYSLLTIIIDKVVFLFKPDSSSACGL